MLTKKPQRGVVVMHKLIMSTLFRKLTKILHRENC